MGDGRMLTRVADQCWQSLMQGDQLRGPDCWVTCVVGGEDEEEEDKDKDKDKEGVVEEGS